MSVGRAHPAPRRRAELLVLLSPATVLFLAFVIAPIGIAVYYSLYTWNGFGPLSDFVGLKNYTDALTGSVFRTAVRHNLVLVGLSLVLQLPIVLALALLLNRRMRGRSVFRVIVFAPYLLSEATAAIVWTLMLSPDGFVDRTLRAFGLGSLVHGWLADPGIVFYVLFVVITWKYLGFGVILLLAGLQAVPGELREAAAIDGASPWQTTRLVVVPLLGPTIRIWVFLSVIGSLQLFDLVWIMTLGGPAHASTTMVTYMIDHGYRGNEYGYGSAVSVIVFVVCFAFALLYQRYVLRRDTEGALTRAAG
ncbi:sugar ABC transporter permease [Catenulispora yoronensis]|uniref:carbohydrate ABC transporter permease n=1 Tax=Catenulispora yoronensis TaxID=450799 RepID=UPI0031DE657D